MNHLRFCVCMTFGSIGVAISKLLDISHRNSEIGLKFRISINYDESNLYDYTFNYNL